ncbi:hypothetical protein Tco_1515394 [Tanacetum coccineum]
MDTKLDRAESKVEKTEYLLHELYQKKFAESEPSAIEELDKSIYDCQVALGECITKSFVGALNARDVLYGPTVHALTVHDTAETIEDCDTYLGL